MVFIVAALYTEIDSRLQRKGPGAVRISIARLRQPIDLSRGGKTTLFPASLCQGNYLLGPLSGTIPVGPEPKRFPSLVGRVPQEL